jgi:hypothetical protein
VKAVEMIGVGGADLPVKALGLGQPPGPMMLERLRELPVGLRLPDRHRNASRAKRNATVPIGIAVILPGTDKVKRHRVSSIAAAGRRANIVQELRVRGKGGGRPCGTVC